MALGAPYMRRNEEIVSLQLPARWEAFR